MDVLTGSVHMIRIGLTGGIGSGKSEVRSFLEALGAVVFDADSQAKASMVEDREVVNRLSDILGREAYQADGSLNKSFISERIFADADLREKVNSVVHPAVFARFEEAAKQAQSAGAPAIVREAALLPAPVWRDSLDVLVAVLAPKSLRLERAMVRDGASLSEIESRMDAQPDEEVYRAVADVLIVNDSGLQDLKSKVEAFWSDLISQAPDGSDSRSGADG